MYIHLGGELITRVTDIVAVLDVRLVSSSDINQEFVDNAGAAKHLVRSGLTPECRALVVTTTAVITSLLSLATLARRMTHLRQAAMAWERET